ncbi:hypothetical protein [Streptomyces sp. NPDC059076]|uniref:hypothetical protein n=1 Tax=unclassified Streptomyces TaxID=2593676 RepID=UPI003679A084
MRRPALNTFRHASNSAWAHPYPTGLFSPIFYNAGPTDPPTPAVPSPADLAARAAAGQGQPPAVVPPVAPPPGDDEEKVTITQRRLNVIMKDEKEEGRRAGLRSVAEAAGIDPDTFDPAKFAEMLKAMDSERKAKLSEEQRKAEELAEREKALAERERKAVEQAAETEKRDRESQIRAALVTLGALGEDLEDAADMLEKRIPVGADAAAITTAAEALKKRRESLFGGPAPATALPPAPGGGPAGGPPARTAPGGKNAVQEAARERARRMGLRTDDAA